MAVDPEGYTRLSESGIGEAGCVTVIADPDIGKLEGAFGIEPEGTAAPDPDADDLVWLTVLGAAAVVAEDNGFQGSRPEVLRPASRASRAGKAASVFWNVNGEIHFTCARRGQLVCAFELIDPDADELDGLPRGLRPLVARCADPDAELIAIGAAMVETFTGVGFGPDDLTEGRPRPHRPRADDLRGYAATYDGLDRFDPNLVASIAALPDATQRRLAHWAAAACVREAGLDTDPVLRAAISRLDQGADPRTAAALDVMHRRVSRESDQRWRRLLESHREGGGLAETYGYQPGWAVKAARYATHPHPLSAAIACVEAAVVTASISRTDRGTLFTDNERGRFTAGHTPDPRTQHWVTTLQRALASDPDAWAEVFEALPPPLTPEERAEALRRDEAREAAGEFATWQYERPLTGDPTPPEIIVIELAEQVDEDDRPT